MQLLARGVKKIGERLTRRDPTRVTRQKTGEIDLMVLVFLQTTTRMMATMETVEPNALRAKIKI
jgi:hypothetical protein